MEMCWDMVLLLSKCGRVGVDEEQSDSSKISERLCVCVWGARRTEITGVSLYTVYFANVCV